jgi:hypothetical protein
MMLARKGGLLRVQYAEAAVELLDGRIRNSLVPEQFPTRQFGLAHELLRLARESEGRAPSAATTEEDSLSGSGKPPTTAETSESAEYSGTGQPLRNGGHVGVADGALGAELARKVAAGLLLSSATKQHSQVTSGVSRNPSGMFCFRKIKR